MKSAMQTVIASRSPNPSVFEGSGELLRPRFTVQLPEKYTEARTDDTHAQKAKTSTTHQVQVRRFLLCRGDP